MVRLKSRPVSADFFMDKTLAKFGAEAMLVLLGLRCAADESGIVEYDAHVLKNHIRPYSRRSIKAPVALLASAGFVELFSDGGVDYIRVPVGGKLR